MKRLIILIFCILSLEYSFSQSYMQNTAYEFCNKVEKWVKSDNSTRYIIRREIKNLCSESARFSDVLTMRLAEKNHAVSQLKTFELEDILNWVENEKMEDESFTLLFTDIEKVNNRKIANKAKGNNAYQYYTCHVYTNGKFYSKNKSLIIIKDDKIVSVQEAKLNDKNKFIIDYDDFINDYGTVGIMYNYSKDFPLGATINYSLEDIPFMISLDFGINFDKDKYIVDDVEIEDLLNYKRKKKVMDPSFFITVTPQVYFKYMSVGCGIGFLYFSGTKTTTTCSKSENSYMKWSNSENYLMFKPIIRPVVKGFVPITDEISICASVGYNYVFNYKDKNGWTFGVGLSWEI